MVKIEYMREWRKNNAARVREYSRKWNLEHADELKKYRKDRYDENKEANRAAAITYYRAHREERRAYNKKWAKDNPEKRRTEQKNWHAAHPHWDRDRGRRIKKEVFAHYGAVCVCCGDSHEEFLTIDHIDGGGTQHREELKAAGTNFYKWLKKNNFPPGYQTLCWNCNCARGFFGICPHERERQAQAAD